MAAQLLDLNYDTRFARFAIDSKSDLNNLPKIDTAGKDNLNTINNVSQGSMAYCTDGKDYILSGENEWIEYIVDGGGRGVEVLYEYETSSNKLSSFTVSNLYKYAAFIVYVRSINASATVPSLVHGNTSSIPVALQSVTMNATPGSTNKITIKSTSVEAQIKNSSTGEGYLKIIGYQAQGLGEQVVIDSTGSPTFTLLSGLYFQRIYGILK